MKIIAKGGSNYVLQASKREVANLIGWSSDYQKNLPGEGDEINISGMYQHMYKISRADDDMNAIADKLELLAKTLRPIFPLQIPNIKD